MGSGSGQNQSGGTSSQTTQYTPTAEETEMNKIYLGQMREADPLQKTLNTSALTQANQLLRGQPLEGYLNKLPGGIDEATTSDIANRSIKDIQPFFASTGLLDSGTNAAVSGRVAGDVRRQSAEFNINNLMQLLNIGTGSSAQAQAPVQQTGGTLSSALAGLRTASSSGQNWGWGKQTSRSENPLAKWGNWCWVAAEEFGGWNKLKTNLTRFYIVYMAPCWLHNAYGKHGKSLASWLHNKPIARAILRPIFEVFAFLGYKGVKGVQNV
jgi:hypothetical protein